MFRQQSDKGSDIEDLFSLGQSVKLLDFDDFKLLMYDGDTEGRQLPEIRRKNIPDTFWRTNRISSPDLRRVVWREQQNLVIYTL